MFYIGIDFGHGETSVSRVPGTNNQPVSRIPLRISGNFAEQKVYSAIYLDNDGKWQFVGSEEDLKRPEIKEGFKGMIHALDDEKREALCEFAKLVFKAILDNDKELHYNPETGEANFVICIANPSGRSSDKPISARLLNASWKNGDLLGKPWRTDLSILIARNIRNSWRKQEKRKNNLERNIDYK